MPTAGAAQNLPFPRAQATGPRSPRAQGSVSEYCRELLAHVVQRSLREPRTSMSDPWSPPVAIRCETGQ
eukprot:15458156-Heterocapsa_arctica.AAC.1